MSVTIIIPGGTITGVVSDSNSNNVDLSGSSGIFKTTTGAVTIGPGTTTFSGAATFTAAATALTVNNNSVFTGSISANGGLERSTSGTLTLGSTSNTTAVNLGNASTGTTTFTQKQITVSQNVATGGQAFRVNGAIHTTLTAGSEYSDVWFNCGRNITFATGAITNQRSFIFDAPTINFAGSSTITSAATVAISSAPGVGSNTTITNNYALWVQAGNTFFNGNLDLNGQLLLASGGVGIDTRTAAGTLNIATNGNATTVNIGNATAVTAFETDAKALTFKGTDTANGATPFTFNTTNTYTGGNLLFKIATGGTVVSEWDNAGNIYNVGGGYDIIGSGELDLGVRNATSIVIGRAGLSDLTLDAKRYLFNQNATSGATLNWGWRYNTAAHTNLTASTEAVDFMFDANRVVQFATGAISTQRSTVFNAPTYSFVGASTITTAATVWINGAPAAGTNATITNPWALHVNGNSIIQSTTGNGYVSVDDNTGAYLQYGSNILSANGTNFVGFLGGSIGSFQVKKGNTANFSTSLAVIDTNGNTHFGCDAGGLPSIGQNFEFRENWWWQSAVLLTQTSPLTNSNTLWSGLFNGTGSGYQGPFTITGYPWNFNIQTNPGLTSGGYAFLKTANIVDPSQLTNLYLTASWEAASSTTGTNNATLFMGFSAAVPPTASTTSGPVSGWYFVKRSADTSWRAKTDDGTTVNDVTTGSTVAPVANTMQSFRLEFYGSATFPATKTVKFYINGTLMGTSTANIYTAGGVVFTFGVDNTAVQSTAPTLTMGHVRVVYNLVASPAAP